MLPRQDCGYDQGYVGPDSNDSLLCSLCLENQEGKKRERCEDRESIFSPYRDEQKRVIGVIVSTL